MKPFVVNFWMACILVSVNACDLDTQYEKDGVCCNMCSPGTRMSSDASCEDPNCIACGEHEYQPSYTRGKKCRLQPFCDPNMNLEQGPLDNKKRVSCTCKSGHHCSSEECLTCVPNTDCKPGEGVDKIAEGPTDTTCQACGRGTFSNESSAVESCRLWTTCDEKTQRIQKSGTPTSDVECEEIPSNVGLAMGLSMGIILLIAVLVAFIIYYFKKDPKKLKKLFKKPGDEDYKREPQMQQEEGLPQNMESLPQLGEEEGNPQNTVPLLQPGLENGVGQEREVGPVEDEEKEERGMTEKWQPVVQEEGKTEHISQPESDEAPLPDSADLNPFYMNSRQCSKAPWEDKE